MLLVHSARFKTVLVQSETTQGTDIIQAATASARGAMAIETLNFKVSIDSVDLARKVQTDDYDSKGIVPTQIAIVTEFDVEFKGIGVGMDATTNKWRLDALYRGGGMIPTYTAGPPKYATYNPAKASDFKTFATVPTFSLWADCDGLTWKSAGSRADISYVMGLDDYPVIHFRTMGQLAAIPLTPTVNDGVMDSDFSGGGITSITYQGGTVDPTPFMGVTCTVHGYPVDGTKFTLNMNSVLQKRKTFQHPNGVGAIFIQDRGELGTTGSVDAEITDRGDFDPMGLWRNGSVGVITAKWGTAFGEIELRSPTAQLRQPVLGERDGIDTWELGFIARKNAGGDSHSLRIGSIT